jgi:hypothetical protein
MDEAYALLDQDFTQAGLNVAELALPFGAGKILNRFGFKTIEYNLAARRYMVPGRFVTNLDGRLNELIWQGVPILIDKSLDPAQFPVGAQGGPGGTCGCGPAR